MIFILFPLLHWFDSCYQTSGGGGIKKKK